MATIIIEKKTITEIITPTKIGTSIYFWLSSITFVELSSESSFLGPFVLLIYFSYSSLLNILISAFAEIPLSLLSPSYKILESFSKVLLLNLLLKVTETLKVPLVANEYSNL